jgi:hypothetical protein
MVAEDVQAVAEPKEWIRMAAEMRWALPTDTWEQTAEKVGRSREQLRRVRNTPEWETAFHEAGREYIERLAPAAYSALLKSWNRGNPSGALDILRSFGLVPKEAIDLTFGGKVDLVHHFEPSPEFMVRVTENLRALRLPESDEVIAIDVPAVEVAIEDVPRETEKPASHVRQVGDDLEEWVP